MRSRTVHLPVGTNPRNTLVAAAGEVGRPPDFVLAFLPPEENLRDILAAMTLAWRDAVRLGCEAVTQTAGSEVTRQGTLQLFWLDDPKRHRACVEVVPGTHGEPPSLKRVEGIARRLVAADGAFLLMDGLRFPRRALPRRSAQEPARAAGDRRRRARFAARAGDRRRGAGVRGRPGCSPRPAWC